MSMSEPPAAADNPEQIRAYYKLEFPGAGNGQGRDYYFQTLAITIGRRPLPPAPRSPSTSAAPAHTHPSVDVHLGALKSVSRLHAKVEYDESIGTFVFAVHGRNGAWVDDVWLAKGGRVPLHHKTKLQIANRTFYFHLPPGTAHDVEHMDAPLPAGSSPIDITSVTPPADSPSPFPLRSSTSPMRAVKEEEEAETSSPAPGPSGPSQPAQKPPYTYAQLCYRALQTMEGRATLQEILDWMMQSFEWFRVHPNSGWQTSVRHTLSMNNAFVKSPKSQGERGKGCNWTIHPNAYHLFENTPWRGNRYQPYPPSDGLPRSAQQAQGPSVLPPAFYTTSAPAALHSDTPPTSASPPYPSPLATTSATPSAPGPAGAFNLPSNVSLPIVIAPPATTTSPASATPHLDAPPIVLDAGRLVLNATIFSHLTPEQLSELQQLGAQQALKILQAYIVEYLKERMRGEKGSTGKPKAKKRKAKKEGKAESAGPDPESAPGEADSSKPGVETKAEPTGAQTVASLLVNPPPPSAPPAPPTDPHPQLESRKD